MCVVGNLLALRWQNVAQRINLLPYVMVTVVAVPVVKTAIAQINSLSCRNLKPVLCSRFESLRKADMNVEKYL